MNLKDVVKQMKITDQIENKQSVLQHGYSVFKYMTDLRFHLLYNTPLKKQWKIPSWVYDNKKEILNNLEDFKTLKHYCLFHDMGKPFSKEFG